MSRRPHRVRAQSLTIVNGMLVLVTVIDVLQLWLLTATMNAYLGGDVVVVRQAVLVSFACLALNVGLLVYLFRLD